MVTDDFLRKLHAESIKAHFKTVKQLPSPKDFYASAASCTVTNRGISVNGLGKTTAEGMSDDDVTGYAKKWARKYGDNMIAVMFTVSMSPDDVSKKVMWVDEDTPHCHVLITSFSVKWDYMLVSVIQYVWDEDDPTKLVPEFDDVDEYAPFEIDTDADVHSFIPTFTQNFTSAILERRINEKSGGKL